MAKVYALYKGDKFVSVGTANELAKEFGHTKDWVHFLKPDRNAKKLDNLLTAYEIKYEKGENEYGI